MWSHKITCRVCKKEKLSRNKDICNACYMKDWRKKIVLRENNKNGLFSLLGKMADFLNRIVGGA